MALARSDAMWEHTSSVMALIANVFRGRRGKRVKPADCHPHRLAERVPPSDKEVWADIREAFTGKRKVEVPDAVE